MKIICECKLDEKVEMEASGHYADVNKRIEIWSCPECGEQILIKELNQNGEHYEL